MVKLGKAVLVLLLAAFSIVVCVVAIAQTKWFKKQLETAIQDSAKKSGIDVSIGNIEGSLPLQWKFSQVVVGKKGEWEFSVKEVKVRLAFLPLLRKQIAISYLKTEGAGFFLEKPFEGGSNNAVSLFLSSFPFNFSLRSFHIDRLTIKEPQGPGRFSEFAAQGSILIKKRSKKIAIKVRMVDLQSESGLELSVAGGRSKRRLSVQAAGRIARSTATAYVLPSGPIPFLDKANMDASFLTFTVDLAGPWATWQGLLADSRAFPPSSPANSLPLHGTIHSSFEPWALDADFLIGRDRSFEIARGTLQSSLAQASAQGKFDRSAQPISGEFVLEIPEIADLSTKARGHVKARVLLAEGKLQAECSGGSLRAGPLHVALWSSKVAAEQQDGLWQGIWEAAAENEQVCTRACTNFTYHKTAHLLSLQEIDLQAPSFSAGGLADLHFSPFSISGDLRFQAQDLEKLQPFLPSWQLAGQCGGSLHLDGGHQATFNLLAADLQWKGVHIGHCAVYADLAGLLQHPQGKIDIEAERIFLTHAYIASLNLHSQSDHLGWPVSLETEGTWKYPFLVQAAARYQDLRGNKSLVFEKIDAKIFEQPLQLAEPMRLFWHEGHGNGEVQLENLALKIGEGSLKGNFRREQERIELALHGEKLPLAWLNTFAPYFTFEGESSVDCRLTATPATIQGSCRLDLAHLKATKRGESAPLHARGSLDVNITQESLQIHSFLQASEDQVMLLHLSLPFTYRLNPISMRLSCDQPLSGSFEIEGKLDEIFSFANSGRQEIRGWAAGKMLLFGTLEKPGLQGNLTLEQASYDNHHIGLGLHDIQATLHAEKDKISIDQLTAHDSKKGNLNVQGEIHLDAEQCFPYQLAGQFDHFDAIDLDLVQATLTGPATLRGNLKEASLQGTFAVDAAEVAIPKSLPADLPDLPFTFSEESLLQEQPAPPRRIFPFTFDVSFDAPDTISFEGNGLTSTWGGKLHMHGVAPHLLASGTLRLSKGQFQILGKTFQLQQGELTFSDKPGHEGFINLSGTLNVHDAAITAQLRGPLSSPQLSFYATPALTTNEIFSLLLFNKRVSEIKPVQAVQLAHTVLTFYGHTGWNPVSQIGTGLSSLGIDTFDIIPSEEGLKQSSITIGKHFYLVRNMLVTLTQSRDSRRFMVEVDIGRGLLFQAENLSGAEQSQQEGKFSLKWNRNY